MKIATMSLLFFISIFCGSVFAGEFRTIELADGSSIYGEIVSFNNGVYTLNTDSLGIIEIDESEIRVIRFKSDGLKSGERERPESTSIKPEIRDLQRSMIGDEEIMNMIFSLQNDPAIQDILSDPEIMNAVKSGDISTLLANPKFMNLLNNINIKEIQKRTIDK